jgi:uncharacterized protein (DUF1778 family)
MENKKTERINLRLTKKQKEIIELKASLVGLSVSGFLVSTALKSRVDGYTEAKEKYLEQKQVDGQMEAKDFLDQNNTNQTDDKDDLWNDDFFSNF